MDLAQGENWLRDTARIEAGEPIEAGLSIKAYRQFVDGLSGESAQPLRQQMQIQALLFIALRQWMETWDLGAGFEETYTIARGFVRQHLADSVQLQQAAEALEGEDASTQARSSLSYLSKRLRKVRSMEWEEDA